MGTASAGEPASREKLDFFESKIRPVLAKHCYECHGPRQQKSGLRLDSRPGWEQGGQRGPAVRPGEAAASLLLAALRHEGPKMPPSGRLSDAVIADFERWILEGAVDPRDAPAADHDAAMAAAADHWAFRPLADVAIPAVRGEDWCRTPVDRFLLARMEAEGVRPAPLADRRTLVRRLSYDLVGLPPSPEAVEAFVTDPRADALTHLVERLLSMPQYGERFGRHWLDVVRYADTAGETADFPVPDAWRYRNYVIDSFNRDKPYDQFVREQLAGDLLAAEAPAEQYAELLTATGYLAIARRFGFNAEADHYLTLEDTIDTLGKSFLGLALGCARCHDHKYDPVSTQEYYALYGIFASSTFSHPGSELAKAPKHMQPLVPPSVVASELKPLEQRAAELTAELGKIDAQLGERAAALKGHGETPLKTLAQGEFDDAGAQDIAPPGQPLECEVRAGELLRLTITPRANHGADTTRVELDIALADGSERWNLSEQVIDGFLSGNPLPDKQGHADSWAFLEWRDGPRFLLETDRAVRGHAGAQAWRRGDTPFVMVTSAADPVQLWITLPPRSVFLHPAPDVPVMLTWTSPVDGKLRIEGRISDGHSGGGDGVGWKLDLLSAEFGAGLKELAASVRNRREYQEEISSINARLAALPRAYCVIDGAGEDARVHERGDPMELGQLVPRGFPSCLDGGPLPEGTSGSGRKELAAWLTGPAKQLLARVMVNRIWLHHFGHGLVETPNDFGARGDPPSHPELLEWLAGELIRSGWSVKQMHRLIVGSTAYQLAGHGETGRDEVDSLTVYARFARRRLDAEQIRDALLTVSGQLDPTPGGPHPFPPANSWNYTQHAPFVALYDTNRRSVYQMVQRIRRHPFLGLFESADPNSSTPRRYSSNVPTQALFFLNDPFLHQQAAALVTRVFSEATDDRARVDRIYRLLLARAATDAEQDDAASILTALGEVDPNLSADQRREAAWRGYTRVLLSSNEFLYVE